ncbi:hypothetical protein C8Q69DRAFT_470743, partial [Paecilomyces variotii]
MICYQSKSLCFFVFTLDYLRGMSTRIMGRGTQRYIYCRRAKVLSRSAGEALNGINSQQNFPTSCLHRGHLVVYRIHCSEIKINTNLHTYSIYSTTPANLLALAIVPTLPGLPDLL